MLTRFRVNATAGNDRPLGGPGRSGFETARWLLCNARRLRDVGEGPGPSGTPEPP